MKKFAVVLALLCVASSLVGCAGTLPTNSYIPQNIVRVDGRTDVGNFTYRPFLDKKVGKENQIQNTAIGSIYTASSVAEYVKRGTALELEKSGVSIDAGAPISVEGNIIKFMADDLGYSVDWTYIVQYVIRNKIDGSVLFDKTFKPTVKKTGKFGLPLDYANVIAECVLSGYDLFIREKQVQEVFKANSMRK